MLDNSCSALISSPFHYHSTYSQKNIAFHSEDNSFFNSSTPCNTQTEEKPDWHASQIDSENESFLASYNKAVNEYKSKLVATGLDSNNFTELSKFDEKSRDEFYDGITDRHDWRFGSPIEKGKIVEMMDADPLLDYLHQHGAISDQDVDQLKELEPKQQQQNTTLLKLVQLHRNGRQLLTNVLRSTGQHYVANLVDDSARIKALSSSGYLGKSRRKGEIQLIISLRAFKCLSSNNEKISKRWVSLEGLQRRYSEARKRKMEKSPAAEIIIIQSELMPSTRGCACCCCSCCCKKQIPKEKNQPFSVITTQPRLSCISETASLADFRSMSDALQELSSIIYAQIADSSSSIHASFLKYLEQDRGVLVLRMEKFDDFVDIDLVCTKLHHSQALKRDYESATLSRAFSSILRSEITCFVDSLNEEIRETLGSVEDVDVIIKIEDNMLDQCTSELISSP